jgi:K+-sensing histidine kinase KdpD
VRISFWIFSVTLLLAGGALILRLPVFPWTLNPDSSVIFGCIFLGDAFYFLYGLLRPRWHNAFGQLLSFLAYDLVLIVPFVALVKTVKPELLLNLVVYIAVLLYSGALAVYYLFINSRTRFGSNKFGHD